MLSPQSAAAHNQLHQHAATITLPPLRYQTTQSQPYKQQQATYTCTVSNYIHHLRQYKLYATPSLPPTHPAADVPAQQLSTLRDTQQHGAGVHHRSQYHKRYLTLLHGRVSSIVAAAQTISLPIRAHAPPAVAQQQHVDAHNRRAVPNFVKANKEAFAKTAHPVSDVQQPAAIQLPAPDESVYVPAKTPKQPKSILKYPSAKYDSPPEVQPPLPDDDLQRLLQLQTKPRARRKKSVVKQSPVDGDALSQPTSPPPATESLLISTRNPGLLSTRRRRKFSIDLTASTKHLYSPTSPIRDIISGYKQTCDALDAAPEVLLSDDDNILDILNAAHEDTQNAQQQAEAARAIDTGTAIDSNAYTEASSDDQQHVNNTFLTAVDDAVSTEPPVLQPPPRFPTPPSETSAAAELPAAATSAVHSSEEKPDKLTITDASAPALEHAVQTDVTKQEPVAATAVTTSPVEKPTSNADPAVAPVFEPIDLDSLLSDAPTPLPILPVARRSSALTGAWGAKFLKPSSSNASADDVKETSPMSAATSSTATPAIELSKPATPAATEAATPPLLAPVAAAEPSHTLLSTFLLKPEHQVFQPALYSSLHLSMQDLARLLTIGGSASSTILLVRLLMSQAQRANSGSKHLHLQNVEQLIDKVREFKEKRNTNSAAPVLPPATARPPAHPPAAGRASVKGLPPSAALTRQPSLAVSNASSDVDSDADVAPTAAAVHATKKQKQAAETFLQVLEEHHLECQLRVSDKKVMPRAWLHIDVNCTDLIKMDFGGLADGFLKLSRYRAREHQVSGAVWKSIVQKSEYWVLAHTSEVVKNSLNPTWATMVLPIETLCANELDRPIQVRCMDWDLGDSEELIGEVEVTLQQLLASKPVFTLLDKDKLRKDKKYLHSGHLNVKQAALKYHRNPQCIEVLSNALQQGVDLPKKVLSNGSSAAWNLVYDSSVPLLPSQHTDLIRIDIVGKELERMDILGEGCDPFFTLWRLSGSEPAVKVYTSETVYNRISPEFKSILLPAVQLCNGDYTSKFRLDCFDWDSKTSHELVGQCEFTMLQLLYAGEAGAKSKKLELINTEKQTKAAAKGKSYANSGLLLASAKVLSTEAVVESDMLLVKHLLTQYPQLAPTSNSDRRHSHRSSVVKSKHT